MNFKTIRDFHWITKMVIALTALLLGLLIAGGIASSYWMSNQQDQTAFNASQGLLSMVMTLASILMQVFLLILIFMAIHMVVTRIKMWIETYLDAMLAKLDLLVAQKPESEKVGATLAAMNEKVDGMEKKLEHIERILVNVGE
ncbi:hypothetical protein [Methanosphaerula palustris]|uniref:Uncharacterized protein n=1 Tax=Methanosphaerula palustris (strain ATCC BAA-1556 / DSM 19958 / E1-9c) TaxID=521011 RepID=B8GKZ2_METPE|nr:hypothetical protein [Methanosphaerula palustris]ACL17288.1 hypothetical protein Mpal_1985 [Methanosphaerula palustris E1-9c]